MGKLVSVPEEALHHLVVVSPELGSDQILVYFYKVAILEDLALAKSEVLKVGKQVDSLLYD